MRSYGGFSALLLPTTQELTPHPQPKCDDHFRDTSKHIILDVMFNDMALQLCVCVRHQTMFLKWTMAGYVCVRQYIMSPDDVLWIEMLGRWSCSAA
jgi:hypothetical protein